MIVINRPVRIKTSSGTTELAPRLFQGMVYIAFNMNNNNNNIAFWFNRICESAKRRRS